MMGDKGMITPAGICVDRGGFKIMSVLSIYGGSTLGYIIQAFAL